MKARTEREKERKKEGVVYLHALDVLGVSLEHFLNLLDDILQGSQPRLHELQRSVIDDANLFVKVLAVRARLHGQLSEEQKPVNTSSVCSLVSQTYAENRSHDEAVMLSEGVLIGLGE